MRREIWSWSFPTQLAPDAVKHQGLHFLRALRKAVQEVLAGLDLGCQEPLGVFLSTLLSGFHALSHGLLDSCGEVRVTRRALPDQRYACRFHGRRDTGRETPVLIGCCNGAPLTRCLVSGRFGRRLGSLLR